MRSGSLPLLERSAKTLAERNRLLYRRRAVASAFVRISELEPVEHLILRRHLPDIAARNVLDLGVGGGRMTPFLAPKAASYTGLDYSPEMVRAAQARFPEWTFRVGDARTLEDFDSRSIDFVLFAMNGIDSVDHADRMRILRSVARVLTRGGLFVFSSHNLDMPTAPASFRSILQSARPSRLSPRCVVKNGTRAGLSLVNYLRHARHQVRAADYAVLVDPAFRCQFLTYYIGAAQQRRQLAAAGFTGPVETFARSGLSVETDASSEFLYYVTPLP